MSRASTKRAHKLISVRVEAGAEHLGRVEDYRDASHYLVGIERNKHFIVPNDTEPIREGDLLYFFGQSDTVRSFSAFATRHHSQNGDLRYEYLGKEDCQSDRSKGYRGEDDRA